MIREHTSAHGQGVVDQRDVDGRIAAGVRVSTSRGDAVADIHVAFGGIELRFVGDVANGAGLRAAAE
jgi:hypothetical protein